MVKTQANQPAEVPLPGQVISVALSLAATTVLAHFLSWCIPCTTILQLEALT
jgi:hypothetical protein